MKNRAIRVISNSTWSYCTSFSQISTNIQTIPCKYGFIVKCDSSIYLVLFFFTLTVPFYKLTNHMQCHHRQCSGLPFWRACRLRCAITGHQRPLAMLQALAQLNQHFSSLMAVHAAHAKYHKLSQLARISVAEFVFRLVVFSVTFWERDTHPSSERNNNYKLSL